MDRKRMMAVMNTDCCRVMAVTEIRSEATGTLHVDRERGADVELLPLVTSMDLGRTGYADASCCGRAAYDVTDEEIERLRAISVQKVVEKKASDDAFKARCAAADAAYRPTHREGYGEDEGRGGMVY